MQLTRNYRPHSARDAQPVLSAEINPTGMGGVDEVALRTNPPKSGDAEAGQFPSIASAFSPWKVHRDSRWSAGRS